VTKKRKIICLRRRKR